MKNIRTLIRMLIIIVPICKISAAQMPEIRDKSEYVPHDSIPMTSADSITDFNGRQWDAKKLTTHHSLYFFSALTPYYPLRSVTVPLKQKEEKGGSPNCFHTGGGLISYCVNYEALIGGDTLLIDSKEKFRKLFAPVESVQEALAFAYIMTGAKPMYELGFVKPFSEYHCFTAIDNSDDLENEVVFIAEKQDSARVFLPIEKSWQIYQPKVISSYVNEIKGGYELLLYHYTVFGCSHPYMREIIRVYKDGKVEILKSEPAFEKLSDIGFCVD